MNIISTVKKTNYCKMHFGKHQLEPGPKPVRPRVQLPPEAALQHVHVPGRETHTRRHQRVDIDIKTPVLSHSSFSVLLMVQCSPNVWIYKPSLFHRVKADISTPFFFFSFLFLPYNSSSETSVCLNEFCLHS